MYKLEYDYKKGGFNIFDVEKVGRYTEVINIGPKPKLEDFENYLNNPEKYVEYRFDVPEGKFVFTEKDEEYKKLFDKYIKDNCNKFDVVDCFGEFEHQLYFVDKDGLMDSIPFKTIYDFCDTFEEFSKYLLYKDIINWKMAYEEIQYEEKHFFK